VAVFMHVLQGEEFGAMESLRIKTKWTLAAAAVWLAGFAAMTALVYALGRPPQIRPEPASLSPRHPTISEISDGLSMTTAPALEMPMVIIAVHRARPAAPRPAPTARPRDISEMNCAPWRDLEMGSGRVQVCE
jgi:hypothetical protein